MKLSKKITLLATALLSLALISCKTDPSETGSSNPNQLYQEQKAEKITKKTFLQEKYFMTQAKKINQNLTQNTLFLQKEL